MKGVFWRKYIMKKKKERIGFISLLTIIFGVLKLLNVISWSWVWVFSPIWISGLIVVLSFGIVLVVGRLKKGRW
jgi:hypothetical protein